MPEIDDRFLEEKMFSAKEIFDLAVKIEENGERFYRNALTGISDTRLRDLFGWLADEEVKHREWFMKNREKLPAEKSGLSLQEEESAILASIVGDQTFSLDEADLSEFHHSEDLIALAQEFEKDTILFFEMIRSAVSDPETLKHLDEIIEEEHRHIQLLDECKEK